MARRTRTGGRPKGGQRVALDIVGLAPNGEGIAEWPDGSEVYVAGTLPGEQVDVTIGNRSRQRARAYGKLDQVVVPSPYRREPPCEHQGRCHGCPLMIAEETAQRRYKRAMLREAHRLDVDRMVHDATFELGYRYSSKRVAGGSPGAVLLGSFRRRSHVLASMRGCLVDHPAIAACARELEQAANELEVEPYVERTGKGVLRYAWFKADDAGQVLVCLVLAQQEPEIAASLAEHLAGAAGVSWCVQSARGNVLRGEQVEQLRGAEELSVPLAGVETTVGPLGFLQPNPRVAALAYQDLVRRPNGEPIGGALALDLFAGAGATTALLQERFEQVIPCESYPESAKQLGIEPETAEDLLERLLARPPAERAVDAVIADPPRVGLGSKLCAQLAELGPRHLHLMSCSGASLRRDLDRLLASDGGFRLAGLRGYDTLPQTPHVELVAWLARRRGKRGEPAD